MDPTALMSLLARGGAAEGRYLKDQGMVIADGLDPPPDLDASQQPHLLSHQNPENDDSSNNEQLLVHVSTPLLCLTTMPLLFVIWISFRMNLGLEKPVLIGVIRSFVQLSILSLILEPIFIRGETCGWLVLAYTTFMILLAALESMNRSKYRFPGMFLAVLGSLCLNILWVAFFAFCIILKPQPLWDPQYVIPIVGMLLGNCINGISLSLSAMLTSLVEQAREIEVYLSFGATPREATSRLLKEAIRVGAVPQLNSMAVIGIISIPGMMTGQILGGSPVKEAARYQMMIIYLISMCTFGTIMTEVMIALQAGFDHAFRLRTDFFVPRKGLQRPQCGEWAHFRQFLCCCCCSCSEWLRRHRENENDYAHMPVHYNNNGNSETSALISNGPKHEIEFHNVQQSKGDGLNQWRLEISNISHSFLTAGSDEEDSVAKDENGDDTSTVNAVLLNPQSRRHVLFQNLSLELKSGEMTLLSGISGAGKTTLLRLIAGLEPLSSSSSKGYIQLVVPPFDDWRQAKHDNHVAKVFDPEHDRNLWRKQVRYVTQYKVDFPGTPKDFIKRITDLQVQDLCNHQGLDDSVLNYAATTHEVQSLTTSWGLDKSCLDTEWNILSGGEAQRVIVAIALASRPKVLLLDESTSALDLSTKLLVEQSIRKYCKRQGISVLWITHDPDQMKRLAQGTHCE